MQSVQILVCAIAKLANVNVKRVLRALPASDLLALAILATTME
jgi:hypothetical protein